MFLDASNCQRSGAGTPTFPEIRDTRIPGNYNDADIDPSMQEFPPPRKGATEMTYFLMWCEHLYLIRDLFKDRQGNATSLSFREQTLPKMEAVLQEKFLKYCDPLDPLLVLCNATAHLSICKMKSHLYDPRFVPEMDTRSPDAQEKKDHNFSNSLKMIELDNYILSNPCLQKFRWLAKSSFHSQALVYLLGDLRCRQLEDPLAIKGWTQIEMAFENRSDWLTDMSRGNVVAIGALCLRVWEAREAKFEQRMREEPSFFMRLPVPSFIRVLRKQREKPMKQDLEKERTTDPQRSKPGGRPSSDASDEVRNLSEIIPVSNQDAANTVVDGMQFNFETTDFGAAIDWEMWDELLTNT